MKSLVIYDSNFGNTKKIAEAIAAALHCEAVQVNKINKESLKGVDLVIIGCPINAWRPTEAMNNFLNSLESLPGIRAASFDTRVKLFISGNAAKKISRVLKKKGAIIVGEPKGFYVKGQQGPLLEGEVENAKKWIEAIIQNLKAK
jgi:flavodoxin